MVFTVQTWSAFSLPVTTPVHTWCVVQCYLKLFALIWSLKSTYIDLDFVHVHVHFVTLNTFLIQCLFSQGRLGIESPLQMLGGMFLLPHHSKCCKQVQWSMWAVYRHQQSFRWASAWWAHCVRALDIAVSVQRVCFGSGGVLHEANLIFTLMWSLFYI